MPCPVCEADDEYPFTTNTPCCECALNIVRNIAIQVVERRNTKAECDDSD